MDRVNASSSANTHVDDGLSVGSISTQQDNEPITLVSLRVNGYDGESESLRPLPVEVIMSTNTNTNTKTNGAFHLANSGRSHCRVNSLSSIFYTLQPIDRLLQMVREYRSKITGKDKEIHDMLAEHAECQRKHAECHAECQRKLAEKDLLIHKLQSDLDAFKMDAEIEVLESETSGCKAVDEWKTSEISEKPALFREGSSLSSIRQSGSGDSGNVSQAVNQSYKDRIDMLVAEVVEHMAEQDRGQHSHDMTIASGSSEKQQKEVTAAYQQLIGVFKLMLSQLASKLLDNLGLDVEFLAKVKEETGSAMKVLLARPADLVDIV